MTRGVRTSVSVSKENRSKREIQFRKPGETEYGVVKQMLGNSRVLLRLSNSDDKGDNVLGIIRGNMRRREWISVGDVVLVGLRDFQDGKVDVLLRYNDSEVRVLKRIKEIATITTAAAEREEDSLLDFGSDDDADFDPSGI